MDTKIFDTDKKLVLEIGGQPKPQAHMVPDFEGAKIVHLNIDEALKPDIVADAANMPEELHGKFDAIFASHVLEHFSYWKTNLVVDGWVKCLKPGGELHVVVPSLEWACREVLSENPSPAVYPQLFAGQMNEWDVHLTGFTMRKLRQLFEKAGLNVGIARTGIYHIVVGQLGEFEALQHYIVGKNGDPVVRSSNANNISGSESA